MDSANHKFSSVACDMAIEQTLNKDSKNIASTSVIPPHQSIRCNVVNKFL